MNVEICADIPTRYILQIGVTFRKYFHVFFFGEYILRGKVCERNWFYKVYIVLYLGISIDVGFIFRFTAVYLGATVLMVQGCCKYSDIVKDTIFTAEIILSLISRECLKYIYHI